MKRKSKQHRKISTLATELVTTLVSPPVLKRLLVWALGIAAGYVFIVSLVHPVGPIDIQYSRTVSYLVDEVCNREVAEQESLLNQIHALQGSAALGDSRVTTDTTPNVSTAPEAMPNSIPDTTIDASSDSTTSNDISATSDTSSSYTDLYPRRPSSSYEMIGLLFFVVGGTAVVAIELAIFFIIVWEWGDDYLGKRMKSPFFIIITFVQSFALMAYLTFFAALSIAPVTNPASSVYQQAAIDAENITKDYVTQMQYCDNLLKGYITAIQTEDFEKAQWYLSIGVGQLVYGEQWSNTDEDRHSSDDYAALISNAGTAAIIATAD